MTAHAKFAPSSASRWTRCPGSIKLSSPFPRTDTVYSREGTFAHECAERLLRDRLQADKALGWKSDNGEFTVDQQWVDYLQEYLDVVYALDLVESGTLRVEERVKVLEECWGTADAMVLSNDRKRLHVIDLKWGQGVAVSPERNEQLMTYGVGALEELSARARAEVEEVHLHVVQPRREDRKHSSWVTTVDELNAWRGELFAAIDRARAPDPELVTGSHCKFCPAAAECPQLRSESMAIAKKAFGAANERDVRASAKDVAEMLATARTAELWIQAVRQRAQELAEHGVKIPGHKLVERLGNRKWVDEVDAADALTAAGVDPWKPRELLSPAQAEKKLGKKAAERVLADLTVRPRSGTVLVPESDRRPAIAPPSTAFLTD